MAEEHHVALFPWLAFGHMLPYLELAKSLAQNGVRVSFISTPRNIKRLPPIHPNLEARIKLVNIPLPLVEGLQEGEEATIDMPLHKVPYLKKAFDALQAPFERVVDQISPDLIIYDFVSCWVSQIAAKFGAASAYFSVFSAAALAFLGPPEELKSGSKRTRPDDYTVAPDWFPFPSSVSHRGNQARDIFHSLNFADESGLSSAQRLARTIESCDFVMVRSCREMEGEYLSLLEDLYQKPVLPLSLLPPPPVDKISDNNKDRSKAANWSSTFNWLDKQTARSVVFVGFGSEYRITRDQVSELAFALELSELPFIWALRMPAGEPNDLDILPRGFGSRTADQGIVHISWVPQLEILSHPAIGGCLFHSGWGSIIESLHHGHALVLLPMMADQGLNARLVVDKGVGLEVKRGEDGVSFTKCAVAKSLRFVMVDAEGEPIREKARQMRAIVNNQELQGGYICRFIQYLEDHRRKESTGLIKISAA